MLTIVTHTNNKRPELLQRCCNSVQRAATTGVNHVVINCEANFQQARYDSCSLGKYIAFVDDDDTIEHCSLKVLLQAIENTNSGIINTDEILVSEDGIQSKNTHERSFRSMFSTPTAVHHLTAIRSECVDPAALTLALQYGSGVEWFMKISAACSGGGVYVPVHCYNWHLFNNSTQQHAAVRNQFAKNFSKIQQTLVNHWVKPNDLPELFDVFTV